MATRQKARPNCDASNAKIGFVGAGRLTTAVVGGLVAYGKIDPNRIFVSSPSAANSDVLKQTYAGLKTSKRNIDVFGRFDCDIIFIMVNGNIIRNLYKIGGNRPASLCTNYIPNMKHQIYILSCVTGFTIDQIKQCLLNPENPEKYSCEAHRIVINCAAAYGLGVCCTDVDPDSPQLAEPIRATLKCVSTKLEYLPESMMDCACTICGSGLAFCYYFMSAVSDGALKTGMSRTHAIKFCAKIASCAAQTLLESNKHPNELKDEVCAPTGGAIYGLAVLDKADVMAGVSAAVEASYNRAINLANYGDDANKYDKETEMRMK